MDPPGSSERDGGVAPTLPPLALRQTHSTAECLLNPNRNAQAGRKKLAAEFAVKTFQWLENGWLGGDDLHHAHEAVFKAVARALRMACTADPRALDAIPSSKGKL